MERIGAKDAGGGRGEAPLHGLLRGRRTIGGDCVPTGPAVVQADARDRLAFSRTLHVEHGAHALLRRAPAALAIAALRDPVRGDLGD